MEFRVLGPLEVRNGDQLIAVRTAKVRTLLVALLLQANRVVTIEELVDQMWGDSPPANPRSAVQTNVQRLRRALGDRGARLIHTRSRGYLIELAPGQLDLLRFRELAEQARQADDLVHRQNLLCEALDLWRGQPLAGTSGETLIRDEMPRLVEERLAVEEQLIDVRLSLGQHARLIPELTATTGRYPLRERPWAQLMLALYRSGRQAEALQAYRTLSRQLAEEVGIDPNDELRRLHQAILKADPSLAAPTGQPVRQGPSWSVHCQLPLDVGDFVGREDQITRIETLLSNADRRAGDTGGVPIVTVSGSPGVGKSALAVRVAHRLRPRFPDGQWYIRLDGATRPRDPADVLADLLRNSGVESADIPERRDARAAAFRARLADRRVLLLLDDAAGADQVEPLLPGTAGCAVLVTARQDLSGLTARYAASAITLDVLTSGEAEALLTRVLGAQPPARDRGAVAELAELCAYLPLALRIAAANLSRGAGMPLSQYVTGLRKDNRLSQLALSGDGSAAVRTAFDDSYAGLRPQPRRLFGLLGLVPGPDFTAEVAAALLDVDSELAALLLDVLANANLIQRHTADRYHFHDLLRLYAAEHAAADQDRETAFLRLGDWYLTTADAAASFGYRGHLRLPLPAGSSNPFIDADQASSWLDAERANLVAAAVRAADTGPHHLAWHLADVLNTYLLRRQHLPEWQAAAEAGLRAAEAAGDLPAQAAMHYTLGRLYAQVRGPRSAIEHHHAALDRYRRTGFGQGQTVALCALGLDHFLAGDMPSAKEFLHQAIALIRRLGLTELLSTALNHRSLVSMHSGDLTDAWRSNAAAQKAEGRPDIVLLINRGCVRRLLGEYDAAAADVTASLNLGLERGERRFDAYAHDELARIMLDAGRLDLAFGHAEQALSLARLTDDAACEAGALISLGDLRRRQAGLDQADAHYAQALHISLARELRIHEAEAHLGLARSDRSLGRHDTALAHAWASMDIARKGDLKILQCQILYVLAAISRDIGRVTEAERHLEQALQIRSETGYRPPAHANH